MDGMLGVILNFIVHKTPEVLMWGLLVALAVTMCLTVYAIVRLIMVTYQIMQNSRKLRRVEAELKAFCK